MYLPSAFVSHLISYAYHVPKLTREMNINEEILAAFKLMQQQLQDFQQTCDITSTECDTTTSPHSQLEYKTKSELIRDLIFLTSEYQRVTLLYHEERNKIFKLESENEFLQEECDSLEEQLVETEKAAENQIKEKEEEFADRLKAMVENGFESEAINTLKAELERTCNELELANNQVERKDEEITRLNKKLKLAHDTNLLLQQIINENSAGL